MVCHRCAGDATFCGTAVLSAKPPRGQITKLSAESIVARRAAKKDLNSIFGALAWTSMSHHARLPETPKWGIQV